MTHTFPSLYRGYSLSRKAWVEGFILFDRDFELSYITEGIGAIGIDVVPESVGVFTGIHDKNGKKVFTGMKGDYHGRIATVAYEQQAGAFWLKWTDEKEAHRFAEMKATYCDSEICQMGTFEITDNLYTP